MYNKCVEQGITKKHLIIENRSTTTKENIQFCAPIIHELRISAPTILTVSSPTHLRRVKMNFERFFDLYPSGMNTVMIPGLSHGCNQYNWTENAHVRNEVATELGFIHEYITTLGYSTFEIDIEEEGNV